MYHPIHKLPVHVGLLDEMLSSMCEPLSQLDGSEKDPGYRVRIYIIIHINYTFIFFLIGCVIIILIISLAIILGWRRDSRNSSLYYVDCH